MERREPELSFLASRQPQQVSLYKFIKRSNTSCACRSSICCRDLKDLSRIIKGLMSRFFIYLQFIIISSFTDKQKYLQSFVTSRVGVCQVQSYFLMKARELIRGDTECRRFPRKSMENCTIFKCKVKLRILREFESFRFNVASNRFQDKIKAQNLSLKLYGHIILNQ